MDEEEICRVCRCGETPEQPLFHPCKCSGSIRNVHQDCLTEWLSHSRKKYCELCEHPFSFTPVYRPDMPSTLPLVLFARQVYSKAIIGLCTVVRAAFVSCIWLVVIPYLTVWNWRFILWSGENLAVQLAHQPQNQSFSIQPSPTTTITANDAITTTVVSNITSSQPTLLEYRSIHRFFNGINTSTFWRDCFEGQIIAFIVVLVVVTGFLLREWLVQNIPNELELEEFEEHNEALENGIVIEDSDDEDFYENMEGIAHEQQLQQQYLFTRPLDGLEDQVVPGAHGIYVHLLNSEEEEEEEEEEANRDENRIPPIARGQPPNAPFMRPIDHHFENVHEHIQQRRGVLFEEPVNDNMGVIPDHGDPADPQIPLADDNNDVENDLEDDNVGDEIDGVLEVLGMRGSFWMLAQNSVLMTLLISLCLCATIWFPYVLGIMFILVTPIKVLYNVFWVVRKVADLVLDSVFHLCIAHTWPFIKEFYISYMHRLVIEHLCKDGKDCIIDNLAFIFSHPRRSFNLIFGADISNETAKALQQSASNVYTTKSGEIQAFMHQTQPTLEYLSSNLDRLATGHNVLSRFVCIAIGYVILIFLGSWYYTCSSFHYASFGRTVRHALRQQGIMLKVSMFVAIELLIFPIACGILLDVSSLPLFSNITIYSRITHFQEHPFASLFIHWFLGTGFMFAFAALITMCRECIRPGVLWFIRDPNDPQFHFIKEIVERPALVQLQKLGISCILYAIIIIYGMSGMIWCLRMTPLGILPLRWNLLRSLSTIPIDFLVVHIAVPFAFKRLEIKKGIKTIMLGGKKYLCRKLRLSSYMFGERHADEEGVYSHDAIWKAFSMSDTTVFKPNGQFVLAPKLDNIPYIPSRRMLVPVDPNTMQIIDPVERELGHPASAEPNDMSRLELIYLPPLFKWRIAVFLITLWSSSIFLQSLIVAVPIVIGRWVYRAYLHAPTEVHDVYSYFAGALVLLLGWFVIRVVARCCYDLLKMNTIRDSFAHVRLKTYQAMVVTGKVVYLCITLGVVLPILLGLVAEMYLILPIRDYGAKSPSVELVLIWTRGLLCMTITHGAISIMPENRWHGRFNLITQTEIHAFDIRTITTRLLFPIISAGLGALLIPFATVVALSNTQLNNKGDPSYPIRMMQSVYPCALLAFVCAHLCRLGTRFGRRWGQAIREDHYLVGTILHNFEN